MIRPRIHLENMYREGQPYFSRFDLKRLGYNEYLPYGQTELYDKLRERLRNEIISAYPSVNDAYCAISGLIKQPVNRLMLTTGTDGGIFNIFLTFCDPKDEVVLVTPNYGMYYVYSGMMDCKITEVKYSSDFTLDYEEVLNAVNDNVKVIALANPSGFTGECLPEEFIDALIKKANISGTIVLLDEVYADYVDYGHSKYLKYIDEYDNLVIVRSFSKGFGLAGVRAGYSVCNENTCSTISHVRQNVEVNSIAVEAIKVWCSEAVLLRRCIDEIIISKENFVNKMNKIGWKTKKSDTNFCIVNVGKDNMEWFKKHMAENKVEIKYLGEMFPDYIRVTIGTRDYMESFIELMENMHQNRGGVACGVYETLSH